ncbi:MAG: site-specific integrase [Treponema sp.]|jgi:integrase|nr:site-specific integrase [Treponema sp.]
MKIHSNYTLYLRVVPSGKRVYYYYAWDENNVRRGGWSTGQTTMTAARLYCDKLLKAGKLIPNSGFMPTFAEYARGWWEWETCAYLKKRRKRRSITQAYADNNRKNVKNHLVPYFGEMPLNRITREEVENWIDDLIEKDYQNTSINGYLGTLKTMLIEAVARKIIAVNPVEKMERLVNDRRDIKIITPEEFKKLFVGNWKRVWDDDRISYTANKLAALTGMRASEVLGLKGAFVYDDHIYLCKQYDEYGYRDTKTKDKHNIPLPSGMIHDLKELKRMNEEGFVFSLDDGKTPVCRKTMYRDYHRALRNIGISDDEIAERHLHLHAWRHFFNTELLKGGLTIPQAQAVTGHKSDRMTEWYCHFDPSEFAKAKQVQEDLLRPEGKEPDKDGAVTPDRAATGKAGRVLPFPAQKTNKKRKGA